MESAESTAHAGPPIAATLPEGSQPVRIDPDLDFIRRLSGRDGGAFRKCMQCGTCSATCALSPDSHPFPRKEMAWAVWGMKDNLLQDADVWLCYQCSDCSTRCPRNAQPGDILAAVRQESVIEYAFPRFVARWAHEPQSLLVMLGIPAALLALALRFKEPLESALGLSGYTGSRIVFSYSSTLPHWLLNSVFGIIVALVLLVSVIGVARFWRALASSAQPVGQGSAPRKGMIPSVTAALKVVFTHRDFAECTSAGTRYWSHLSVFYGFLALTAVTLWVITSGVNPLITRDFVYPFGFWNPWKILANVGGIALVAGCALMIRDRLREGQPTGGSTFSDWGFLGLLFVVGLTGFITEVLHYVRLEPHRHIAYFAHLVCACALLLYLPYSKFAHLLYRTTALVFSEYTGRSWRPTGDKK